MQRPWFTDLSIYALVNVAEHSIDGLGENCLELPLRGSPGNLQLPRLAIGIAFAARLQCVHSFDEFENRLSRKRCPIRQNLLANMFL